MASSFSRGSWQCQVMHFFCKHSIMTQIFSRCLVRLQVIIPNIKYWWPTTLTFVAKFGHLGNVRSAKQLWYRINATVILCQGSCHIVPRKLSHGTRTTVKECQATIKGHQDNFYRAPRKLSKSAKKLSKDAKETVRWCQGNLQRSPGQLAKVIRVTTKGHKGSCSRVPKQLQKSVSNCQNAPGQLSLAAKVIAKGHQGKVLSKGAKVTVKLSVAEQLSKCGMATVKGCQDNS